MRLGPTDNANSVTSVRIVDVSLTSSGRLAMKIASAIKIKHHRHGPRRTIHRVDDNTKEQAEPLSPKCRSEQSTTWRVCVASSSGQEPSMVGWNDKASELCNRHLFIYRKTFLSIKSVQLLLFILSSYCSRYLHFRFELHSR